MQFQIVQPGYGHKNLRIRTKPLRQELVAPKDKNKKGFDNLPILSLTYSFSSYTTSVLSLKGYPNITLTP